MIRSIILFFLVLLQLLLTIINAADGVVFAFDDASSSSSSGIDMGTTLVALHYRDGIVVGADTRTSSYPYVSNREAYKITPIHNINVWDEDNDDEEGGSEESDNSRDDERRTRGKCHVVIARSGSAADTQYLASTVERAIYREMLQRRQGMMMRMMMSTMDTKTDGVSSSSSSISVSVSQIAHLLRYIVRETQQQNGYDFAASLIVAGWESSSNNNGSKSKSKGQGRIYSLSRGGTLLDESTSATRFAVSGSGSTVLLGQLDSLVSSSPSSSSGQSSRRKNRLETMDQHDAIKLCCSLLQQSMARDNASGGMIRLVVLDDTGRHSYTVYPNQQRLELAASATRSGGVGDGDGGRGRGDGPRRHSIDLLD